MFPIVRFVQTYFFLRIKTFKMVCRTSLAFKQLTQFRMSVTVRFQLPPNGADADVQICLSAQLSTHYLCSTCVHVEISNI